MIQPKVGRDRSDFADWRQFEFRVASSENVIGNRPLGGGAPLTKDWVTVIRDRCHTAGARFFFKKSCRNAMPRPAVRQNRQTAPSQNGRFASCLA